MQLDEAAHILGGADFFSICDLEQRRMLAFAGEQVLLAPEEVLFRAGDITEGAYVLISGTLNSQQSQSSENEVLLIDLPGTVIGELALITKHPRRATVTAVSEVELLMVPRTAFAKLMKQFPDIVRKAETKIRAGLGKYVGTISRAKGGLTPRG